VPTYPEPPKDPVTEAKEWIDRGQALVAQRQAKDFPEVLRSYSEAIKLLEPLCSAPANPLRDLLAVAYTHQGFTLLASRDEAALQMALASFDRAIALRSTLLDLGEPWFRYNLAGVWINRADTVAQRGAKERLPEAMQAYDEAVRIASGLDSASHPAFAWRKAVAWLNRGSAVLRFFDPTRWEQAQGDFEATLRELEPLPAPKAVAVASAWTGLGEVALRRGEAEQARLQAGRALHAIAAEPEETLESVQTGLRACLLLGAVSRKEAEQPGQKFREAEREALDQIEDGLDRALRRPDRRLLMPLIIEAFVHCTRAYGQRQPQFLAEFMREALEKGGADLATPQTLKFAVHELDVTLNRVSNGWLPSLQRETIESVLTAVTEMRTLRQELADRVQ
jgi:tetratricopeptide (TPR) repeat protein